MSDPQMLRLMLSGAALMGAFFALRALVLIASYLYAKTQIVHARHVGLRSGGHR